MRAQVLAMSLLAGTLAVWGPSGAVEAAPGTCGAGEVNISGKVTENGSPVANRWVELRLGVNADTGPWLGEPANQSDETDVDGDFTICLTQAERTALDWNNRTKWQIFAHPDLSAWTGPAAPSYGITASEVKATSACASSSCSANVVMQAPTIWSTEEAHFYLVLNDDGFVAYIPGFSPGSPNLKKMAAAYPFASGDFRIKASRDTSNDPYDNNESSEFVLSRYVSPSSQGVVGQIVKNNLLAEIVLPNGNPVVLSDPENATWPSMFVARLVDGCDPSQPLRPDCFANFDQYEPGKLASQILPGVPYAVWARYDRYPLTAAVVMLVNDNVVIVNNPTGSGSMVGGKLRLTMRQPSLVINARGLGNAILPMDFTGLKWNGEWFDFNPLFSTGSTGADGSVGWSPADGIWQLRFAQPFEPSEMTSAYATTFYVVSVSAVGTPSQAIRECTWTPGPDEPACNGSFLTPEAGAFNFSIDQRNVVVTVRDLANNVVPNSNVAVREVQNGNTSHLFNDMTNSLGQLNVNLSEGTYRVEAEPSDETPDQSAGIVEFSVTSSATVGTPLSVGVRLTEPNFQGSVLAGQSPSAFSGIGIDVKQQGDFFQQLRWSNTNSNGQFSLSLPGASGPGARYRLTLEPPSAQPDYTRTSVYLLVSAEGVVCVTETSSSNCLTPQPIVNGKFVLNLNSPNVRGRINDPDGNPVSGWVGLEKWLEGQGRFQWIDGGAQAGMSGNFSMFLEPGIYKLGAEPFAATGLSKVSTYIKIAFSGQTYTWCPIAIDDQQAPIDTCTSPAQPSSVRHVITLLGSNFSGIAKRADGTVISQSWAEAWVQQGSAWTPLTSSSIRNNGTFGMRIETTPNTEWKQIRVTANPPWGSTDIVKTSKLYWAKGSVICADVAKPASNCSAGGLVTGQVEFVLVGGNVGGRVTLPDGSAASGIQISVERNISGDWWEWVDIWAQTNAQGNYSLPLETPTEGDVTYRITARPQGRTDVGLASRTVVVNSACTGCLVTDITLALPNVTATIRNSGAAVESAWVQVEKQRRFCRSGPDLNTCPQNDVETWWEWTGIGADSNSQGQIALPLTPTNTPTTYRLVVQGPWNAASPLPRFTSNSFELQSGVTTSATLGTLSFPAPNLQFTLRSGSQNVANAWVSLERLVNGWWQWVDIGANSSAAGKVSLYLSGLAAPGNVANDEYRLVVNTPWGDSSLPTFRLGVNDLLAISPVGGVRYVSYPGANVTGSALVSPGVPNRYSWLEVVQWNPTNPGDASSWQTGAPGNWVTGLPLGNTGNFATRLDDGTYLLRVHPNGTFSSGPMEILAKVASGVLSSWSYRGGTACSGGQCSSINASFADVPKNLEIIVRVGDGQPSETFSAPTRKVFVTLEAGSFKIGIVVDSTGTARIRVPENVTYQLRVTDVDSNDVVKTTTVPVTPTAVTNDSRVSITVNLSRQ